MKLKINCKKIVSINGQEQKIHIWGTDPANPIILFVHGGPGSPFRHKVRKNLLGLCDEYTLAAYDQRNTGGSFADLDPQTLTIDNFVKDIADWAEWLAGRFGQPSVYLVGESWGSFIGTLALLRCPRLFTAYIGYGQLVDEDASLIWQYERCLETAHEKNLGEQLAILKKIGFPSEGSFASDEDKATFYRIMYPLLERPGLRSFYWREVFPARISTEYSLADKIGMKKGDQAIAKAMKCWPKMTLLGEKLDFEMPYYVFSGRNDYITPGPLLPEYMKSVRAPKKELVFFENAGHSVAWEDTPGFIKALRKRFI